jgi:integrase
MTFARAWDNYIDYLGEDAAPIYEIGILRSLGARQCADIDDAVMGEVVRAVFPAGASPATLNRHVYTPVIAALRMALKHKAPQLARPKGHNDVKPVEIAAPEWFARLWPHLNANQQALTMFLACHGRRIREALARRPCDLRGTGLDLGRTKTGLMFLELEPEALALIQAMPGWRRRTWLFGAGPNSANSVRRDLKAACARAGVPWISPHKFGRHTSVTRMLRKGYSVAHVAQAHNMTPEMVTRRYGHLTVAETTEALHAVGGELARMIVHKGESVGDGAADMHVNGADKPLTERGETGDGVLPAALPSEGSALSDCATGADENARRIGRFSVRRHIAHDRT